MKENILPSAAVSLEMIYQYIAKKQDIKPDSALAGWFESVREVLNTRPTETAVGGLPHLIEPSNATLAESDEIVRQYIFDLEETVSALKTALSQPSPIGDEADSDAKRAIEDLRYVLDDGKPHDPENDYYSDIREPVEVLIKEVYSYHRALKVALHQPDKTEDTLIKENTDLEYAAFQTRETLKGVHSALVRVKTYQTDIWFSANLDQALSALDALIGEG